MECLKTKVSRIFFKTLLTTTVLIMEKAYVAVTGTDTDSSDE